MRAFKVPLSGIETTALMQIALRARLAPGETRQASRLIHLGLADEGPDGLSLTAIGKERYRLEALKIGLIDRGSPSR
jgi:hypothetical protein